MKLEFVIVVSCCLVGVAASPAGAQQSASFKLIESTLNSGGHPGPASNPASASHRVTLGSIGDALAGGLVSSPSFHLEASFVSAYPPPDEARNLAFTNRQTLRWNPERSAGHYDLYRDVVTSLSGLGYGACFQQNIPVATTTDASLPSPQQGFFYLVTAENRLNEEGTKGFRSNGAERAGNVCP